MIYKFIKPLVLVVAILSFAGLHSCTKPKADEAVGGSGSEGGDGSSGDGSGAGSWGGSGFNPETIYFGYDQANLSSSAQSKLALLVDFLKANSSSAIEVIGHCDERGSEEYNLALGSRRANAVKNFLVSSGVAASRINTASYGEEQPAVQGHDESSWEKNRRAEFVLTVR